MKTHGPIVQQLRRIVRDAESRGITQYRLALLAGIDKAQFTRLMHGTVDPRVQTTDKIANRRSTRAAIEPHSERA